MRILGVEPSRDDIAQPVVDDDIEHDVRVRAMKTAEPKLDDFLCGRAEHPHFAANRRDSGSTANLGPPRMSLHWKWERKLGTKFWG
jgi:hypothetical protein